MIQLQENYYTLPPEAYTFTSSSQFSFRKCTVAISYSDDSSGIYILGDTFMRNFVTTFDFKNEEMRMAINVEAPAGVKVEYKMSGWKIFLIIVGCLIGLGLIIWITICLCKRRKSQRLQQGYQTIRASVEAEEGLNSNNEQSQPS